ncbi:MAG: hypothetical protein WCC37_01075 [Candidatus Sulfotelmatobacter sp.]|jgi:hypothetical protein
MTRRVLSGCLVLGVAMLAQKTGSIVHGSTIGRMIGSTIIGALDPSACGSASPPSWCSGSDIGAWTNACIAQFSANQPGLCILSTGTYELKTTIVKPQWVTIDGNNSVLRARSLTTPAIITATTVALAPSYPGSYARRGIRDLTLLGNGPTNTPYGIWLGGDYKNKFVASTAVDFLEQFDNVQVQNFGTQYEIGTHTYQDTWIGGTIMGGYNSAENGVAIQAHATGAENMTFVSTMFEGGGGNTGYALYMPDAYGSTINLDHASLDYWGADNLHGCPNRIGNGQVLFNDGHLSATGTHFETCSGPHIVSNSSTMGVAITIGGGTEFTNVDGTHSLTAPGIIEVTGNAPQVYIDPGTLVSAAARQRIKAYVANTGTGGQIWVGPYVQGSDYQIPAWSGVWNAGVQPTYAGGLIAGFSVTGELGATGSLTGHALDQKAANNFAGKCTMASATSCTFTIGSTYTNYVSFASIDQASAPPAAPIAAKCNLSGMNVTITAGASNSLTWDCMIVGNPN